MSHSRPLFEVQPEDWVAASITSSQTNNEPPIIGLKVILKFTVRVPEVCEVLDWAAFKVHCELETDPPLAGTQFWLVSSRR